MLESLENITYVYFLKIKKKPPILYPRIVPTVVQCPLNFFNPINIQLTV